MATEPQRHGGPGRGQGRKPLKDGEPTVVVSVRMTAAQRDILHLLGGSEWVRGEIDSIPPKKLAVLRQLALKK
jgi:hypothetical protein